MPLTRLCITMGDAAGIGPEIILKALRTLRSGGEGERSQISVAGSAKAFDAAAKAMALPSLQSFGDVELIEVGGGAEAPAFGQWSAQTGDLAYRAIVAAVEAQRSGRTDAIVTAPLSKEALHLAGHHYPGHTELLAALTGGAGPVMMLAHGDFRVSHVTTHIPLEQVPTKATPERLARVVTLTHQTLIRLGVDRPRIAVAALNPHAGEGGVLGRYDIDVAAPVLEKLRADGIDVVGPVPGDTVFVKMRARQFDAVVAMYHDQGHIPVKLLGFSVDPKTGAWEALSGVNITLGLPIIRTSVDHGTAFDIAGKGIASERSLIEAIEYAELLASRKQ
ncbi:4-hydroxythreonine-4-phosphate dehydrogenase [Pseudolabrys sp. Root1462]|uniref:4-hydroxythreonine-4-phosphate dehydrogenase PdxA n=1 Tax=Pseudolabrys sp. Root1462 TaxID=1736466 RepID=UPI0007033487|nr:4-hydroxythreonine-4-phosphate dehydrogenase PdxA [Pseudolabrys sp. Root1462]KQZ01518.1 4-hydroxythreonine-4-phosphate dehydrogenase [Pseudolabrys sp. Root1462]